MQRGQTEVAGVGELERRFHGVVIANLAEQNHIGGRAHRRTDTGGEGLRIDADLALRDHRALVLVQVFDRIFQGENMPRRIGIAVIDHGGEGRGLARTGGPDHHDQTVFLHDQIVQHPRQVQILGRRDVVAHVAEHERGFAALTEGRAPKASEIGHTEAEVHFAVFFELFDLPFRGDAAKDAVYLALHQLIADPGEAEGAFDQDLGAGMQVDVLAFLLHHQPQVRCDFKLCVFGHARVFPAFAEVESIALLGPLRKCGKHCVTSAAGALSV